MNNYRGKAEFSSFEESEHEQRLLWAKHTPEERLLNLFRLMDNNKSATRRKDETSDEFLLIRKKI